MKTPTINIEIHKNQQYNKHEWSRKHITNNNNNKLTKKHE